MRQFSKITTAVLVLWLTACDTTLRRAQTPPTPQPAAAKPETPPAPDEPLSTPQTHVLLPQPQPIDAEALATPEIYTPTEPSTAHTSRKPAKHPSPQPAAATIAPPKPDTAEVDAPPAAAESQRPAIEPVLPANQRRQMTEEISSRLKEVDQVLGRAAARGLSNPQKTAMDTIRSFRDLSYQALEHGDIQKAGGLADRALLLAQELDRAR